MKSIETDEVIPLEAREAVGERMLGERDPRTLSREEFERSPDVLFHGSRPPMERRKRV